ncbi:hypothetical protein Taro_018868 [Colocasia esculenta]|uniref:Protein LURP-one-related 8 n=1 Tax=Colocasia esculenta TaxID=4460 RepID=A0A843UJR0_COLES|nr:hypothetical protein [Colocasia esculenta]
MAKVHPDGVAPAVPNPASLALFPDVGGEAAAVLTVWKKSLLLNFEGFTVFDSKGDLVFRVDNYASSSRGVVVLMDATGEPLLTVRRKRLSLGERWLVYEGEGATRPRFSVKKHANMFQGKTLAQVTACAPGPEGCCAYEVEGSYSRRSCAVFDAARRGVAEITTKDSPGGVRFGGDVFRLVVQPGFDATVAMAIVVLLEQMFGSGGSLIKG